MPIDAFALSDVGRVRTRNEDSFVVRADLGFYAVADGMGGHVAGDIASKTALDAIVASMTIANDESLIGEAVKIANLAVWERSKLEPDKAGMGTTLTALLFSEDGDHATVGHVGDSRCYRMRGDELLQITEDHTVAPRSNMLTRALGTRADVEVDVVEIDVQPDDLFLLCSDGLTGMIEDEDLAAILKQEKPLQEITNHLVEAANLRGGVDNITAVLLKIDT